MLIINYIKQILILNTKPYANILQKTERKKSNGNDWTGFSIFAVILTKFY